MLYRYMQYKGWDLPLANARATFSDNAAIADWAAEAVTAVQRIGIIVGRPGNVYDPQGITTRAEYAAIFARLINAYASHTLAPPNANANRNSSTTGAAQTTARIGAYIDRRAWEAILLALTAANDSGDNI